MTTLEHTPLTRSVDGTQVPAAGTYTIDAAHTDVGFSVRHLMVSKTKGRFGGVSGTVTIAEDPAQSAVEVEIDAASIDTRDPGRDEHLRSADFLDIEAHPTISYRSTSVRPAGRDWHVEGELTVRGVTLPVPLVVTFEGAATSPWGTTAIGFTARTDLDREAFGLTWNQTLETGGVLVGKQVRIDIDAEANAA